MNAHEKHAAVRLDEVADRALGEITVADFVELLDQQASVPHSVSAFREVRVKDALAGIAAVHRIWPEKKKVEREAYKAYREHWPWPTSEKKKVELEQPWRGLPQDPMPFDVGDVGARLTAIEQQLARLG